MMLDFLRNQKKGGSQLLLSPRINTVQKLRHLLLKADRLLEKHEEEVGGGRGGSEAENGQGVSRSRGVSYGRMGKVRQMAYGRTGGLEE